MNKSMFWFWWSWQYQASHDDKWIYYYLKIIKDSLPEPPKEEVK